MELSYTPALSLDGASAGAMAENISDRLLALTSADVGTCQGGKWQAGTYRWPVWTSAM